VKPSHITIGMAQMRVDAGQPDANLQRAWRSIADAAVASCDLVVLPECLDFGWCSETARHAAQPIPGSHTRSLADAARRHRIFVAAGLVERAGDRLYNAAVFIGDQGELLLHHRKINEIGAAGGLYATGDRLGVAHTRLGCIGLNICADNLPESLCIGHTLAAMGAQVIVSPSAWAVPPGHDNVANPYGALWRDAYAQLASAHGMPVVGVSAVGQVDSGPWTGWPVIGASLAISADGRVAAQCDYGSDAEQLRLVRLALRHTPVAGAAA
jgi:predicted amidohydrolase